MFQWSRGAALRFALVPTMFHPSAFKFSKLLWMMIGVMRVEVPNTIMVIARPLGKPGQLTDPSCVERHIISGYFEEIPLTIIIDHRPRAVSGQG
jgi:hypothetical protein